MSVLRCLRGMGRLRMAAQRLGHGARRCLVVAAAVSEGTKEAVRKLPQCTARHAGGRNLRGWGEARL